MGCTGPSCATFSSLLALTLASRYSTRCSLHWRPEPGPLALGRSGGELLDGGFIVVKQAPEDPACVSAHEEGHTLFAQTLVLEGKTRASMAYELVRLGLRAHELIAENGDPRATARPVPNKKLSVCTQ